MVHTKTSQDPIINFERRVGGDRGRDEADEAGDEADEARDEAGDYEWEEVGVLLPHIRRSRSGRR